MMSQKNNSAKALRINPADNVAIALTDIAAGEEADVVSEDGSLIRIEAIDPIPLAHKIALAEIGAGEKIIKYGESIGAATRDIHPGEHVHVANVKSLRAGS
jgi:altronate dehydratase small subunit